METITSRPDLGAEAAAEPRTGDRFVAIALGTVALLLLALQGLAGEVIPPLAVFALIYLGVAVLVDRTPARWPLAVAIVLALVHLLGSIPFFIANLAHPESPASFLSEAFVGLAALTALAGAVAGLRGPRPAGRRPLAIAAGVLAAAAVVISVVAAAGVESAERQPGDVPVETVASTFPAVVEVPAGGAVLWVDNQDPFHHTLVIEGTDVRQALPGSNTVRMDVDLAPGTYRYLCDVPGHEKMAGEIVAR